MIETIKDSIMQRNLTIPPDVMKFITAPGIQYRSRRSVLKSYDILVKKTLDAIGETSEIYQNTKEDLAELREILKRSFPVKPPTKEKGHTKVSMHAISQMFTETETPTLFDQHLEEHIHTIGMKLRSENMPKTYGLVLTDGERQLMEAILKTFTETNYQGHLSITTQEEFEKRGVKRRNLKAIEMVNKTYSNIKQIPVIQVTQADLLRTIGAKRGKWAKIELKKALEGLQNKRFFFYWKRLMRDERGNPVVVRTGNRKDYKKEKVESLDSLFRIDTVYDEANKLKYYEISPSAVLLDQVEDYFLLIPYGWREEVKRVTGKRPSKYTLEFLLWLRMHFEKIRSSNNKPGVNRGFTLKRRWEDIAATLNVPESVYKNHKAKSHKIREDAYYIAQKLGYLTKIEQDGVYDVLHLNRHSYPQPGQLHDKTSEPEEEFTSGV